MKKKTNKQAIQYFNENAQSLFKSYSQLDRETFLSPLLKHLNHQETLTILDVGAGGGQDAFWLATNLNSKVTAVDPSSQLLKIAQETYQHSDIIWANDQLPNLKSLSTCFNAVILSACWQYLLPEQRKASSDRLTQLCADNGLIYLLYPTTPSREYQYCVNPQEIKDLFSTQFDILEDVLTKEANDRKDINGNDLYFHTIVFRKKPKLSHQ